MDALSAIPKESFGVDLLNTEALIDPLKLPPIPFERALKDSPEIK